MPSPSDDVFVTLPFSRLLKLLEPHEASSQMQEEISKLHQQIISLKRDIEGLHGTSCELMIAIGELRRSAREYDDVE